MVERVVANTALRINLMVVRSKPSLDVYSVYERAYYVRLVLWENLDSLASTTASKPVAVQLETQ